MADITLNTVTLPEDLDWTDEYSWSGVRMQEDVSISGTTHLQVSGRTGGKGRRITLAGAADAAWIDRSVLDQLIALRDIADLTPMTLTLADARVFSVLFDHTAGDPIAATPVLPGREALSDNPYVVTLKFIEV